MSERRLQWMPQIERTVDRLDRPLVVSGFGCLDGSVFVSCFRLAGALAELRRYAGVRMLSACARRSLPAECLEA